MKEIQIKGALGYSEVVEVLSDFWIPYRAYSSTEPGCSIFTVVPLIVVLNLLHGNIYLLCIFLI